MDYRQITDGVNVTETFKLTHEMTDAHENTVYNKTSVLVDVNVACEPNNFLVENISAILLRMLLLLLY